MPSYRIVRESGAKDTRSRAETYLRTVVGDKAPEARWQTHADYAAKTVDAILSNTEIELVHMKEYADYFSNEPGGSATGRSVEPAPYMKLGADRDLLQVSGIAALIVGSRKAGVTLWNETALTDLILDGKTVTGGQSAEEVMKKQFMLTVP